MRRRGAHPSRCCESSGRRFVYQPADNCWAADAPIWKFGHSNLPQWCGTKAQHATVAVAEPTGGRFASGVSRRGAGCVVPRGRDARRSPCAAAWRAACALEPRGAGRALRSGDAACVDRRRSDACGRQAGSVARRGVASVDCERCTSSRTSPERPAAPSAATRALAPARRSPSCVLTEPPGVGDLPGRGPAVPSGWAVRRWSRRRCGRCGRCSCRRTSR
jgi:hypothetical protein